MMKLSAIRVKDVGCFVQPTALEGLGDGLNILSGRNELGKSTLLAALRAAFEMKHTSTDKQIVDLCSYGTQAPLIEVDFETGEGRWRIRKQFLSGKFAALTDLATGAVVSANNDVQARLDDLLKRGPQHLNRFTMLWVEQGDMPKTEKRSAKDMQDEKQRADRLANLFADEIDTLTIDAHAQQVQALVKKALEKLQTEQGKPKKGGAWQLAQDALANTQSAVENARVRESAHGERLRQLAEKIAQRDKLRAPDGIAALAAEVEAARSAHTAAESALRSVNAAKALRETRFLEQKNAQQFADTFRKADRERARAQTELDEVTAKLHALAEPLAEAEARFSASEAHADGLQQRVRSLEAEADAARRAEAAVAAHSEFARQAAKVEEARSLRADRQAAADQIAALAHVSAAAVADLDAALLDCSRHDARFEAIAPEVSIRLDTAGAGRVTVDGNALAADATFNPVSPLDIGIAGVGRIRVAPHPATASAEARAARSAAHARVATLLSALRVTSAADAKAQLERRQAAERQYSSADNRLIALAPAGVEALTASLAANAAHATAAAPPPRPSIDVDAELSRARTELAKAEATCKDARDALTLRQRRSAELKSAQAIHIASLAKPNDGGDDADGRAKAEALETAAKAAFADADIAFQTVLAHSAAHDLERAKSRLDQASAALERAREDERVVDLDINRIEGALEGGSDEDIVSEHRRQVERLEEARRHLADVEAERAALIMLRDQFDTIAQAGREQISAPVRARIQPYLTGVLPGAVLALDDGFGPKALMRGHAQEELHRLSQGTREQIAIVTRMGLGKLLADRQAAVPLILDDALVFTDDERIEAMFSALSLAARSHQVIVFTCRSRAFAGLAAHAGATSLTLKPWPQSALAA